MIRSDDGGQTAEHKKRHRKKSSKKAKKHRSKKRSHSQSNSDNSSDSDASSNEEEVVKRKKQKKHKKSKRRGAGSGTDNDDEVKIVAKPAKVHYVSDGEDERNVDRNPKRQDERKRHAEPLKEERHEYKSKWDSPKHDLERGKFRGDDRMYRDARVEGSRERNRPVQQAPPPYTRPRFPEERERFERRNDDHEYRHREQPPAPKLEKPGKFAVESNPYVLTKFKLIQCVSSYLQIHRIDSAAMITIVQSANEVQNVNGKHDLMTIATRSATKMNEIKAFHPVAT